MYDRFNWCSRAKERTWRFSRQIQRLSYSVNVPLISAEWSKEKLKLPIMSENIALEKVEFAHLIRKISHTSTEIKRKNENCEKDYI